MVGLGVDLAEDSDIMEASIRATETITHIAIIADDQFASIPEVHANGPLTTITRLRRCCLK